MWKYLKNLYLKNKKMNTTKIQIGLVSFAINAKNKKSADKHYKSFIEIINTNDNLDIIVFSGWTLLKKDLNYIQKNIKNKNSLILFEIWDDYLNNKNQHKGYYFKNGILHDKDIVQLFATSKEINNDIDLMEKYLEEIKNKRIIKFKNKNICWLICGEINVLRNIQKEKQRVIFRHEENKKLKKKFYEIYNDIDIFINPTHTIMGNQGKMARRREFLSKTKIFCSTSNADTLSARQKLNSKSIQYLYSKGKEIEGTILKQNDHFIFKKYIIN